MRYKVLNLVTGEAFRTDLYGEEEDNLYDTVQDALFAIEFLVDFRRECWNQRMLKEHFMILEVDGD
jgi:hypothetical protein